MSDFCLDHRQRIDDLDDAAIVAEAMIVSHVIEHGNETLVTCWACRVPRREFDKILVTAAVIDAQADAHGGSYETRTFSLFKGNVA